MVLAPVSAEFAEPEENLRRKLLERPPPSHWKLKIACDKVPVALLPNYESYPIELSPVWAAAFKNWRQRLWRLAIERKKIRPQKRPATTLSTSFLRCENSFDEILCQVEMKSIRE